MSNPSEIQSCTGSPCPIQFIVNLIGSKWAILILRELFAGHRRTHDFLEALPGISTKTLTQRLRELEHHGLIFRKVYPEIPPHVEYSLTEKGRELKPVMQALYDLGSHWLQREDCVCSLHGDLDIHSAWASDGEALNLEDCSQESLPHQSQEVADPSVAVGC